MTVQVPPNAVAQDESFSIGYVTANAPALPAAVTGHAGTILELKPHGIVFNRPATVTLPLPDGDGDGLIDGTGVTADWIQPLRYDESLAEWQPIPGGMVTINAASGTMSVETAAFSWWIFWTHLARQEGSTYRYYLDLADEPISNSIVEIEAAIETWDKRLQKIDLIRTANPATADLSVAWSRSLLSPYRIALVPVPLVGNACALTNPVTGRIVLDARDSWDFHANTRDKNVVRTTVLHEMAHFLGIMGHFKQPDSVIGDYPPGTLLCTPTQRDRVLFGEKYALLENEPIVVVNNFEQSQSGELLLRFALLVDQGGPTDLHDLQVEYFLDGDTTPHPCKLTSSSGKQTSLNVVKDVTPSAFDSTWR
ncbi:matrixin family metalloprotease [Planctomycetota bacterium]